MYCSSTMRRPHNPTGPELSICSASNFGMRRSANGQVTAPMEVHNVERRLAAILATDVVGYSRLMEVDEAGTLARLKTVRLEVIDPAIGKCRGRIIKTAGDGMLIEFQSV